MSADRRPGPAAGREGRAGRRATARDGTRGRPSPRLSGQGMLATAGMVALVTLLARVVGLVRWVVFSDAVGATCVGQVYATANQVPNVLFEVAAGGALAAVAVPLVSGHLERGREDLADRTASALMTWTVAVLLPLAVVVALAAGPVTVWLLGAPVGCDAQAVQDAGRLMLLLFAPQVVLYGVGIVLSGVLQGHRRFLAAAAAPLLSSVAVVAVYVAFGLTYDPDVPLGALPTDAIVLLAGGTTLGVAALSLPLLLPAARLGVRWRPTFRLPEGTGRRAGALAAAGVVVVAAQQLTTVVVLLLTNASVGVAGITVWTYAQTAYLLPYAVLVVPLATVVFPRLTGDRAAATAVLRRATVLAVVASVAAALVLVATRREIGAAFLLLDAGADGPGRRTLLALPSTVAFLGPGLVGYALLAVGTRALYAVGSPLRAAAAAALGWAVAALVPLLTIPSGTEVGTTLVRLAVGSSLGMSVAGALLVLEVWKVWGASALRGTLRAAVGAAVGGLPVLALCEVLAPVDLEGWVEVLGWAVVLATLVLAGASLGVRLLAPEAWRQVVERVSS